MQAMQAAGRSALVSGLVNGPKEIGHKALFTQRPKCGENADVHQDMFILLSLQCVTSVLLVLLRTVEAETGLPGRATVAVYTYVLWYWSCFIGTAVSL